MNKELHGDMFTRERLINDVSQLLIENSNFDIEVALTKVENYYSQFDEHIRNVYEVYSLEVPLFWLWYLKLSPADNWGWSAEEHQDEINKAYSECKKYFLPL